MHHFPYELLRILNLSVYPILLNNLGVLGKVVLIHLQQLSLKFVLLLVYQIEVVSHDLIHIRHQLVISCAPAHLV